MVSRHWLYFAGFVVTGSLLIGAGLIGVLEGLSALSGDVPASEEFVLLTMLAAAAEWVIIVLVLGLFAVLFLTATVISVLRNASLPRDDRLVSIVNRLERQYPILRQFDVAEKVEPTTEDRKRELKQRYVNDEISEEAFEREMEQLMDDNNSNAKRQPNDYTTADREERS